MRVLVPVPPTTAGSHRKLSRLWSLLQQRRRSRNFIARERLSAAEAAYLPPNFNPGPEYD